MIPTKAYGKYDIEPFNPPVRAIGESTREAGPAVLTNDTQEVIDENSPQEVVLELGQQGLTAAASDTDVSGYPQHYDDITPTEATESAQVPLQPGEYGYSDDERFKPAPAVLTREEDK